MRFWIYTIYLFLFSQTLFAFPLTSIAKNGMVVSEEKLATSAGVEILKAGGNAIDAAVAVGYALAVTDPCCGNIGGGGFMTIHLANGKNMFVNFREKAPMRADKNMYLHQDKDTTTKGYLAVAVPGTVLGLDTVLKRYGTLSRERVMQAAIQLAQEGFIITPYEAKRYATYAKDFHQQKNVAAIFFKNNRPLQAGDVLIQKDLANTLRLIAKQGAQVFYRGSIAKTIVTASEKHGGILTLNDFANYTIEIQKPIHCQYRGYTILSASPPSSGGVTLCEMLEILAHFPLNQMGYHSALSVKTIVEAMRDGFYDRNSKLGDPDFIKNPVKELLSDKYIDALSQKIRTQSIAPISKKNILHKELTDTTHYSVIDNKGNAVSVTYTLNGFFGAGVIAGNTGFFLNDEMDDFTTHPNKPNKFGLIQTDANAIESYKRPISSMTPTIVMKNNHVFLILGSPGGPRIITATLLTLLNIIDYHLNLQTAINAPRFHFQGEPNSIDIEPNALPDNTIQTLKKWRYPITIEHPWAAVAAILVDDNQFYGAMDVRRPDGAALGF